MEWPMRAIFNATSEVARIAEYPNIRIFKTKHMTSAEPQDDLMEEDFIIWAKSTDENYVNAFSAVCLLTATYWADVMGKEKVLFKDYAFVSLFSFG